MEHNNGPELMPRTPEETQELTLDTAVEVESAEIIRALQERVDAEHERVNDEEVTLEEKGEMYAALVNFVTSAAARNASKQ